MKILQCCCMTDGLYHYCSITSYCDATSATPLGACTCIFPSLRRRTCYVLDRAVVAPASPLSLSVFVSWVWLRYVELAAVAAAIGGTAPPPLHRGARGPGTSRAVGWIGRAWPRVQAGGRWFFVWWLSFVLDGMGL